LNKSTKGSSTNNLTTLVNLTKAREMLEILKTGKEH